MPLPIVRYPLDPTGLNPDNRVVGEVHTLNARPIRALAPTFGPFYAESLVVHDDSTNQLLVRGQDYQIVELLQEATVKFGKEICELVLILNQAVSSTIRISYQVLGGLFQNNASAVINMYETYINDNRPVDWLNVLNKPLQYPPTLHNHLLQDVYGFEPVVIALERIRNAIILSDVPAFEALIEWVKARTQIVTEQEIIDGSPSNKLMTLERMLFALDQFNFNAITITPTSQSLQQGDVITVQLSTTNLQDNTVLYWTIQHLGTQPNDFGGTSGIINIMGNRGQFNISIGTNVQTEPDEHFKIQIRKNSPTGFVLAETSLFTIGGHIGFDYEGMLMNCCCYNPEINFDPVSYFYLDSY